MRALRFHHGQQPDGPIQPGGDPASEPAGRLNMLLSYAGWEDEPWIERLPRLLEPMGVASHLARSGREANRLIRSTPIHIAIVDLGLPLDEASAAEAEGGVQLLSFLARLGTTPPTVVVKRGRTQRDDRREIAAALRAGAFAVVNRPRESRDVELVLEVLRRLISRHYAGRWPV